MILQSWALGTYNAHDGRQNVDPEVDDDGGEQ